MGLLDIFMPYKPATTGLGPNRPAQNGFTNWANQNPYTLQGLGAGLSSIGAGMVGHGSDPRGLVTGINQALAAQQGPLGQLALNQRTYDVQQQQIKQQQDQQNQTVKWLQDKGRADLAEYVSRNLMTGSDAVKMMMTPADKPDLMKLAPGETAYDPATNKPLYTAPKAPEQTGLNFDDISGLRKEVFNLQSYKRYATAAPIYEAMKDAAGRDSRASDLNLVYGLASIMDPTSVVREGEQIMVQNTASLPSWLQGQINALNGGASLDPQTRERIMQEAYGRTSEYEKAFAAEAQFYENIGNRYGINNADIIPPYSAPQVWKAPVAPVQSTGDPELDSILQQYGG